MRALLVRYGLAMTSVVLVAFLVPLGLLARSLAEERALTTARQDAQAVAVFAGSREDEARLDAALRAVNADHAATTVFLPDGRTIGAPAGRTSSVELAALGTAFTARTEDGAEVLLPVGGPGGVTVVRTAVPQAELTEGVTQAWATLAAVGVVLLAGTVLAGRRLAARLSRSVHDLASVAQRLGAGDLEARVVPSGPAEVASVGAVLNDLGGRVTDLLADERAMVADLSHRLRTPITALRLDVDSLADADERRRLGEHVDDLVDEVDTLIRTARRHGRHPSPRCDAARVVGDRARFWAVLAASEQRPAEVRLPAQAAPVGTDAATLGAALDVLVDNVFRHTAPGTPYTIEVSVDGDVVHVTVTDAGPGLTGGPSPRERRPSPGSTGLGLEVARRTAERAGGRLRTGSGPQGGTVVELELPVAPPPSDGPADAP